MSARSLFPELDEPETKPPGLATVYGLTDPDGSIRYVGVTLKEPARRAAQHLGNSFHGKGPRDAWLRDLRAKGQRPGVVILEQGRIKDRWAAERRHIAAQKAKGARLLNREPVNTVTAVSIPVLERLRAAVFARHGGIQGHLMAEVDAALLARAEALERP